MSIQQFAEAIQAQSQLCKVAKYAQQQTGQMNYVSNLKNDLNSLASYAFSGRRGQIIDVRSIVENARNFDIAFRRFLDNQDNLDVLANPAFLSGTLKFENGDDDFIRSYISYYDLTNDNDYDQLTAFLRLISLSPKEPEYLDILNTYIMPRTRGDLSVDSYIVKPSDIIVNPMDQRKIQAAIVARTVRDEWSFVEDDAIYVPFILHDLTEGMVVIDSSCGLQGMQNLYASSVTIDIVTMVDGYVLKNPAFVRDATLKFSNSAELYKLNTGAKFAFRLPGPGAMRLYMEYTGSNIPEINPKKDTTVWVRIRGRFTTSLCGLSGMFNSNYYSEVATTVGFPGLLTKLLIRRGEANCDGLTTDFLYNAFVSIYNKALARYAPNLTAPQKVNYALNGSMYEFGKIMEALFLLNYGDNEFPVRQKCGFARHMFTIGLILHGLAVYSV